MRSTPILLSFTVLAAIGTAQAAEPTKEQLDFFEKKVRPILSEKCYKCHSVEAGKSKGGLTLDTQAATLKGGEGGPAVVPGDLANSLLITAVSYTDKDLKMPPDKDNNKKLSDEEIASLTEWVKMGAPDPRTGPAKVAKLSGLTDEARNHWSFQPVKKPAVPAVRNRPWCVTPVDAFIVQKLEEKQMIPAKKANPETLLRRATYDLTGLPPTPEEIVAFMTDGSPNAFAKVVDRLLASPHYGERWGRFWLDTARYSDTTGNRANNRAKDYRFPYAWTYRDYVVRAFNEDKPYDQFIVEQLAADQLPDLEDQRDLAALGFITVGDRTGNANDVINDRIDTVTKGFLALTVACARCHDHKFDPIPTTDYYALASIFTSTVDAAGVGSRMGGASLQYYEPKLLQFLSDADKAPKVPQAQVDKLKTQVDAAKKTLDDFDQKYEAELKANPGAPTMGDEHKKQRAVLARNWINLSEELKLTNDLGELGYGIHGARDGVVTDTAVRIRGVEERHGPVVPRNYLSLVKLTDAPVIPPGHSGRLELAQWITNPAHPLTARVYVNRVWQHLFGTGIVSTVDNFGSMGDQPSNPQLLDYLAQDFIRNGWSTKRLVREIVLSRAYRLGTEVPSGYRDIDPGDRLIWRHAPRRLEAEEIRDSILRSSGQLDLGHPNGSPSMRLRMIEMRDDGPVVHSILKAADRSPYRSIYLPQLRGEVPRPLAAFDPVSQTLVTGQREETTVPTQALFLLNSPFVRDQSLYLASDLLRDKRATDSQRIRAAFERIVARDPNPQEIARVKQFLAQYGAAWRGVHPENRASTQATLVSLSRDAQSRKPFDLTDGIFRSDNLVQDDPDDTSKQVADETPVQVIPDSAQKAAWAALVQSLFGSAEFQFVR